MRCSRSDGTLMAWPVGSPDTMWLAPRLSPSVSIINSPSEGPAAAATSVTWLKPDAVRLNASRAWVTGCGSIAIEFLRATRRSRAFAIEQDAGRRDLIARNAAALGVPELHVVAGTAPAALADLLRPDAVFVGGGVTAEGMLEHVWAALAPGGRLVANAVTVEGEARLVDFQSRQGGDLVRIAVTRAGPVGDRLGWRPLMPVTQLAVSKPGTEP